MIITHSLSVAVSCSYQCLRMLNYMAQPTLEIVQILLIISSVLSYSMNVGASYTLLGRFMGILAIFFLFLLTMEQE